MTALRKLKGRYWSGKRWLHAASEQLSVHGGVVHEKTGKGKLRQFAEVVRLALGRGRLTAEEYYFLQLYDDASFEWSEKERFVGYSFERSLRRKLNMQGWYVVANDKILQGLLLERQGVPTPRLRAVFHPMRQVHDLPTLTSRADVKAFLLNSPSGELVLKPIYGARGKSVYLIDSIDRPAGTVRLATGESVAISDLLEQLSDPWREGFLLQELLRPHPEVSAISGGQLCCARIIMLVDRDGARPWRCVWRLPAPNSMVDNVSQEGNLIATVDATSGIVGRVVAGHGPDATVVSRHPRTGLPLEGFRLPEWAVAMQACLRAARLFPSFHIQSWDIALTTRGPVILEVNPVGGAVGHQLAYQKGFLQPDMEAFLRRLGAI